MRILFESEAELEKFIHEKFIEEGICCIDGTSPQYLERQFQVGTYGVCDLVAVSVYPVNETKKHLEITVYELKKEKITADAFAQVSRYATAIRGSIEQIDEFASVSITCALVATEIDESCFILNETEFQYYKPFFDPASGVSFEEIGCGWHRDNQANKFISDLLSIELPIKEKTTGGFE